ncbi:MAG: nucleotidyl transferase AbiEii/AbiGii toxin family protein [Lachnospiraceae bacterium]|nr:nucleotidyl transferase AbiEii/AbiGii toxin family protein [Lachnospiraceae bacterium]
MAVKNKSASALARLRNQAKEEGISYQMSLQLFFQEEFLRRLSHSRYRDNLILKGGMFIYVLTEFDSRPTRDMDFMLRSLSNELGNIKNVMEEICSIQTDNDYIWLEVTRVEQITLEKKYPGVKTKFIGHINNVRVPFSVDVGIDDVIVPNAEIREIATRLEGFEAPEIYTYSLESTIAEKFDAILQRM